MSAVLPVCQVFQWHNLKYNVSIVYRIIKNMIMKVNRKKKIYNSN